MNKKVYATRMQLSDSELQSRQPGLSDNLGANETPGSHQRIQSADEAMARQNVVIDTPEADDGWFSISETIAKADTGSYNKVRPSHEIPSEDGVFDLATLDGMGREVLAVASYDQVVDVNIDDGGVLEDDEDNNELFCGVGLDALVESEQILKNLKEGLNIETATHVQLSAIPRVLDKRDVVIQSHTGTGKTLAFLLPLLDEIETETPYVQGIIVAPTRELGMQIFRECERLCEDTGIRTIALIGGANPVRQVDKLRKLQPHIVVGTPGRIAELEENRELRVRNVGMFVVDEVDQCVQAGMGEDVIYLLKTMMRRTQKVLVSATSDVDSVRSFAGQYLHKPVLLRVGGAQRLPKQISHWFCVVPARMRVELVRKLMHTNPVPTRAIAFVDDPRRVDIVVDRLYQMKIVAGALRGNAHKLERAEVLTAFRKGKINLLITTEVAARGLDIPEISHVFNLDLPTDGDHYVHRAGRCGRVRNVGTVVSITTAETAFVMRRLEKELGVSITRMEPRGGDYGPVANRRRQGENTDRRKQMEIRGGQQRVEGMVAGRQNTNTLDSRFGDENFSSSELIDERSVMSLVRQIEAEDASDVSKTNAVAKPANLTSRPKKKAKGKTSVDRNGKRDDKKKPKVKQRWRDMKAKGKPTGKLGKKARASDSSSDDNAQVKKMSDADTGSKKKAEKKKGGNFKGGKSKLSFGAMAARDGWVGNR